MKKIKSLNYDGAAWKSSLEEDYLSENFQNYERKLEKLISLEFRESLLDVATILLSDATGVSLPSMVETKFQDKNFDAALQKVLKLEAKLIDAYGGKLESFVRHVIESCMCVIRASVSAALKLQAVSVVCSVCALVHSGEWRTAVEASIHGLLSAVSVGGTAALKPTVKAGIYKCLGQICMNYPEMMEDFHYEFANYMLRSLEEQMDVDKKKKDLSIVTGCLEGFDGYFHQFGNEAALKKTYAAIELYREDSDRQRHVHSRAGLALLSHHSDKFKLYLYQSDLDGWCKLLKNMIDGSNADDRKSAIQAHHAIFTSVAKYISEVHLREVVKHNFDKILCDLKTNLVKESTSYRHHGLYMETVHNILRHCRFLADQSLLTDIGSTVNRIVTLKESNNPSEKSILDYYICEKILALLSTGLAQHRVWAESLVKQLISVYPSLTWKKKVAADAIVFLAEGDSQSKSLRPLLTYLLEQTCAPKSGEYIANDESMNKVYYSYRSLWVELLATRSDVCHRVLDDFLQILIEIIPVLDLRLKDDDDSEDAQPVTPYEYYLFEKIAHLTGSVLSTNVKEERLIALLTVVFAGYTKYPHIPGFMVIIEAILRVTNELETLEDLNELDEVPTHLGILFSKSFKSFLQDVNIHFYQSEEARMTCCRVLIRTPSTFLNKDTIGNVVKSFKYVFVSGQQDELLMLAIKVLEHWTVTIDKSIIDILAKQVGPSMKQLAERLRHKRSAETWKDVHERITFLIGKLQGLSNEEINQIESQNIYGDLTTLNSEKLIVTLPCPAQRSLKLIVDDVTKRATTIIERSPDDSAMNTLIWLMPVLHAHQSDFILEATMALSCIGNTKVPQTTIAQAWRWAAISKNELFIYCLLDVILSDEVNATCRRLSCAGAKAAILEAPQLCGPLLSAIMPTLSSTSASKSEAAFMLLNRIIPVLSRQPILEKYLLMLLYLIVECYDRQSSDARITKSHCSDALHRISKCFKSKSAIVMSRSTDRLCPPLLTEAKLYDACDWLLLKCATTLSSELRCALSELVVKATPILNLGQPYGDYLIGKYGLMRFIKHYAATDLAKSTSNPSDYLQINTCIEMCSILLDVNFLSTRNIANLILFLQRDKLILQFLDKLLRMDLDNESNLTKFKVLSVSLFKLFGHINFSEWSDLTLDDRFTRFIAFWISDPRIMPEYGVVNNINVKFIALIRPLVIELRHLKQNDSFELYAINNIVKCKNHINSICQNPLLPVTELTKKVMLQVVVCYEFCPLNVALIYSNIPISSALLDRVFESAYKKTVIHLRPVDFNFTVKRDLNTVLSFAFIFMTDHKMLLSKLLDTEKVWFENSNEFTLRGGHFMASFSETIAIYLIPKIKTVFDDVPAELSDEIKANYVTVIFELLKIISTSRNRFSNDLIEDLIGTIKAFWGRLLQWAIKFEQLVRLYSLMALASKQPIETFGSIENDPSVWLLEQMKSSDTNLKQKSELVTLLPSIAKAGCASANSWCTDQIRIGLSSFASLFPHSFVELQDQRLKDAKVALLTILTAARDSGNADILQCVIQITAADEVHVCEDQIRLAIEEMCGIIGATQQTELASNVWNIVSNATHDPKLRVTVLDRFFVPILRNCSEAAVFDLYSTLVGDLYSLVKSPPSSSSRTDYQAGVLYTDCILAFTVAENLFANLGSELPESAAKLRSALDRINLPSNKFLGEFCKRCLFARNLDHVVCDTNRNSREFFRLYQCRAYRCLASALSSRKSDNLQHYMVMFQTPNSAVRPWNLIVDTSHLYKFPLSDIEMSKQHSIIVAMRSKSVTDETSLPRDVNLTAQASIFSRKDLFLQTLSDNVLNYDLTASYVRDQVQPAKLNYTNIQVEESSLNKHECMGTVCAMLRMLVNHFSSSAKSWLKPLLDTVSDSHTHVNFRLFIAQAIYNEREALLPFAEYLLEPIMMLIVDLYTSTDSMHVKLIVMLLSWKDRVRPSTTRQNKLASSILEALLKNLDPNLHSVSTHYHTISLIEALVSNWHTAIVVPYDVLNAKLRCGGKTRSASVHVAAVLLLNGLPVAENMVDFYRELEKDFKVSAFNQESFSEVIGLTLSYMQRDVNACKLKKATYEEVLKDVRAIVSSTYTSDKAAFIKSLYYIQKTFPDVLDKDFMGRALSLAVNAGRGAFMCILTLASGLKILLENNDTAFSRLDHLDLLKNLQSNEGRLVESTLRLMEELARLGEYASLKPFFKDIFECSRLGSNDRVRLAALRVFMAAYKAKGTVASSSKFLANPEGEAVVRWCGAALTSAACSRVLGDTNSNVALEYLSSELPENLPDRFCDAVRIMLEMALPDDMHLLPTGHDESKETTLGTLCLLVLDVCKKAPDFQNAQLRDRPLKEVDSSDHRTGSLNTFSGTASETLSTLLSSSKGLEALRIRQSTKTAYQRRTTNSGLKTNKTSKTEMLYPSSGLYPDVEIKIKDLMQQVLLFSEADPECSVTLFISLLRAIAEQQGDSSIFYARAAYSLCTAILKNSRLSRTVTSGVLKALLLCFAKFEDHLQLTEVIGDPLELSRQILTLSMRLSLEAVGILVLEQMSNLLKNVSAFVIEPPMKKLRLETMPFDNKLIERLYDALNLPSYSYDDFLPTFAVLSEWDEMVEASEPITNKIALEFVKWLPEALQNAEDSENKAAIDQWIECKNYSQWIMGHPLTKWGLVSWQVLHQPIERRTVNIDLSRVTASDLALPAIGELREFVSASKAMIADNGLAKVCSLAMSWNRSVPGKVDTLGELNLWSARLALRRRYVSRIIQDIEIQDHSQISEMKRAFECGQRTAELHLAQISNRLGDWELATNIVKRNYTSLMDDKDILDWSIVRVTSLYLETLTFKSKNDRLGNLLNAFGTTEKLRKYLGTNASHANRCTITAALSLAIFKDGGPDVKSGSAYEAVNWCERTWSSLSEAINILKENHCEGIGQAYLKLAEFCWEFVADRYDVIDVSIDYKSGVVDGVLQAIIYGAPRAGRHLSRLLLFMEKIVKQHGHDDIVNKFTETLILLPVHVLRAYTRQLLSSCSRYPQLSIGAISKVSKDDSSSLRFWSYFRTICEERDTLRDKHTIQRLDTLLKRTEDETKLSMALRWVCCPFTLLIEHLKSLLKSVKIKDKWDEAFASFLDDVHSTDQSGTSVSLRGHAFNVLQEVYPQISQFREWKSESLFEQTAFLLLEQINHRRNESVEYSLENLSPYLANYRPTDRAGPPAFHDQGVTIVGFDNKVRVMKSLRRPHLITMTVSDGSKKRWLVKRGDDLGHDQGILQLLANMDSTVKEKSLGIIPQNDTRVHNFDIFTYKVVPLSRDLGLVQWVDNCFALRDVALSSNSRLKDICIDIINRRKDNLISDVENALWQYQQDRDRLPKYIIRDSMMNMSNSAERFFYMRETFNRYLAAMSIAHWILGIGDRHLSNILLGKNGALFGVDYARLVFGEGIRNSSIPELMPFRLTPKMVAVFDPRGTGVLKLYMCQVLGILRTFQSFITAEVEMFVRDFDFDEKRSETLDEDKKSSLMRCGCSGRHRSYFDKLMVCSRKLSGLSHPSELLADELRVRIWCATHSQLLEMYVNAVNTASKYETSNDTTQALSVEEQVTALLDTATSENLLSLCYFGWEPWI